MATVNHVGEGMIGLEVILRVPAPEERMIGKVVKLDTEHDLLYVTWAELPHTPELGYACEKFETRIGDNGKLFLVLNLD